MTSIRNIDWTEESPERVEPGMLIRSASGSIELVGTDCASSARRLKQLAVAWAWLIQPYQLEWLEDMAQKHQVRARV